MISRAPGKVVLSGAYAVLEGAPALVAAVDRYVIADSAKEPSFVTPEVLAALASYPGVRAPWFDARALRDERSDRKLGVGSSAAILVASLGALELTAAPDLDDRSLADRVFATALRAHQKAQGGGSGIDVAASAWGGVLEFRVSGAASGLPRATPFLLPEPLVIEVWASAQSAQTSAMLAGVRALAVSHPAEHRAILDALGRAAEDAIAAHSGSDYIAACRRQLEGLADLGRLAEVPIVTPDVTQLDDVARAEGALVMPSGAGGGDIVLFIGEKGPSPPLESAATHLGFARLDLKVGARGVHAFGEPSNFGETR